MRRWLLILLAATQIGATQPTLRDPSTFETVSLIAIIANPDHFDGKRVRAAGFLILEFEGNSLYVDRSAYEAGLTTNAVWVEAPDWASPQAQKFARRYVLVEGTFNPRNHGHVGAWPGSLEDVRLIQPVMASEDFQRYRLRTSIELLWLAMPGGLFVFFGFLIIFGLLARLRIRRRPKP